MSEARSFINARAQTYESLKAGISMSANQRAKFDVLNAHIVNSVVVGGELVIVGDPSTPSCTSHEAFLMAKASIIHHDIVFNNVGVDDFFLDNFDLLQSILAQASLGVGVVSDGWGRYLNDIKDTLVKIDLLYYEHMRSGALKGREEFYAKRKVLFVRLEEQLGKMAAYGSGLRIQGSVKRMLELSTKSYLATGEIARYVEKVAGVAKAANLVKKGGYIGIGLEVASAGLSIHKACTFGREEECKKARYIESGALAGSLAGSAGGGLAGAAVISGLCTAIGVPTAGVGTLACAVIGGAVGGKLGGEFGKGWAGNVGELIYGRIYE
ncbi:hypothetical protein WCE02_10610 [Pseudomonas juntendi]|uniref:hypothetical protein n=1 Tax=Pseudomonas TaxID=286 RepID=UPI0034D4ACF1